MVLDAHIMLMDGPLTNLNEVTDRRQLLERVLALWENEGKTEDYNLRHPLPGGDPDRG